MSFLSEIAKVTNELYIGGLSSVKLENLLKLRISHIINCTIEVKNIEEQGIITTKTMIDDSPTANLQAEFDRVADLIEDVKKRSGRVLVHCVAGVSRSASLCLAYLMKYHGMTLLEAHSLLKKARPIIRPNLGFWKQLVEYENLLFGCNSVRMIESPIGFIPDIYKTQTKNMI